MTRHMHIVNIARNQSLQKIIIIGLRLGTIIVASMFLSTCDTPEQRGPELEVKGETSWYKGTPEEKQYLLSTFKESTGVKTISWPPEELRRIVDISVDITGSGYKREVLFNDQKMPLAEYNLRKFREYLLENAVLQPGDRIYVRLFGAKPGGQDVDVDEYKRIDYPGLQVDVQATVFDRRFHDVEIAASNVSSTSTATTQQVVDSVAGWFLPYVETHRSNNEAFMQSPLLQHVFRVCQLHRSNNLAKKLYIFVTDGHFQVGDYYFSPSTFSEKRVSIDALKKTVERMKIKPFTEPDRSSSVILFGLAPNGVEEFRQAQQQILQWFFDPLSPRSVELVFNQ